MPLRNSKKKKKKLKVGLKCNSFYSKCTFINKILKSTLYSINWGGQGGGVSLLTWGGENQALSCSFRGYVIR